MMETTTQRPTPVLLQGYASEVRRAVAEEAVQPRAHLPSRQACHGLFWLFLQGGCSCVHVASLIPLRLGRLDGELSPVNDLTIDVLKRELITAGVGRVRHWSITDDLAPLVRQSLGPRCNRSSATCRGLRSDKDGRRLASHRQCTPCWPNRLAWFP